MKRLLISIFFACLQLSAAARYFVAGGVDNNWGTIGNWSLTSGGAGGQTVPSASDDCHFDANSPNVTLNTSARTCLSIDFTGWPVSSPSRTVTMSQQLTVSGAITLVSGMLFSGSGALIVNNTATLTSNGVTWPNAFTLATGAVTYTLADDWTITGLATLGITSGTTTINGSHIYANGSLTIGVTTGVVQGTTIVVMQGTGTFTASATSGSLRLNTTWSGSGTITFASGTLGYGATTLTFTAGPTLVTPNNLNLAINSTLGCTLVVGGVTFGTIAITGAQTTALSEDLHASGLVTVGSTTASITINGNKITAPAGLRFGGTTGVISGTTLLQMTGAGTLDAPSLSTNVGRILNPIEIAAGAGTAVSITSPINIDMGKFVLTSGNVTSTGLWSSGGGFKGAGSVQ